MNKHNRCNCEHGHGEMKKQRRGISSFAMHDSDLVFRELKLKSGDCFLDAGCGAGDYTIRASKIVGDSGVVYAMDKQKETIVSLIEEINSQGLKNIKAAVSDIACPLPIEDKSIDVCLIATVLHISDVAKNMRTLFNEVHRVLKPEGRVAVIEIKKEETPFGPPIHMRLSEEDVANLIIPYGFEKTNAVDLGCNYMIQFSVK